MTRVLVIDDDRLQYRLLQQHFRNFRRGSYELDWSETYEDGLARLLTGAYAVCLLDYRLGQRDGLQLIQEAARSGCRTPIVFLTAESSDNIDIQAMEAGRSTTSSRARFRPIPSNGRCATRSSLATRSRRCAASPPGTS